MPPKVAVLGDRACGERLGRVGEALMKEICARKGPSFSRCKNWLPMNRDRGCHWARAGDTSVLAPQPPEL